MGGSLGKQDVAKLQAPTRRRSAPKVSPSSQPPKGSLRKSDDRHQRPDMPSAVKAVAVAHKRQRGTVSNRKSASTSKDTAVPQERLAYLRSSGCDHSHSQRRSSQPRGHSPQLLDDQLHLASSKRRSSTPSRVLADSILGITPAPPAPPVVLKEPVQKPSPVQSGAGKWMPFSREEVIERCGEIAKGLLSAEELPESVRMLLSSRLPQSIGIASNFRHEFQERCVEMTKEALLGIECAILQKLEQAMLDITRLTGLKESLSARLTDFRQGPLKAFKELEGHWAPLPQHAVPEGEAQLNSMAPFCRNSSVGNEPTPTSITQEVLTSGNVGTPSTLGLEAGVLTSCGTLKCFT